MQKPSITLHRPTLATPRFLILGELEKVKKKRITDSLKMRTATVHVTCISSLNIPKKWPRVFKYFLCSKHFKRAHSCYEIAIYFGCVLELGAFGFLGA